jgi:hypothetical protein
MFIYASYYILNIDNITKYKKFNNYLNIIKFIIERPNLKLNRKESDNYHQLIFLLLLKYIINNNLLIKTTKKIIKKKKINIKNIKFNSFNKYHIYNNFLIKLLYFYFPIMNNDYIKTKPKYNNFQSQFFRLRNLFNIFPKILNSYD